MQQHGFHCRRSTNGFLWDEKLKEHVWQVDTGISRAYSGPISALEVIYEVRDVQDKQDVKLEREKITAVCVCAVL